MLKNIETIVLVYIYVILLVAIFKPIKSAFNLNTFPSCVLSVCVSILCIIGMSRFLKGSFGIILLSYAALGIAILLMLLFSFIGKHSKGVESHYLNRTIKEDGSNYIFEQKKKVEANPKKLKE